MKYGTTFDEVIGVNERGMFWSHLWLRFLRTLAKGGAGCGAPSTVAGD